MCGGQRVGVCVPREGGGERGRECQIVLSHWQIVFTETAELWEKRKHGGSAICFACCSLSPRHAEYILIKDTNTRFSIRWVIVHVDKITPESCGLCKVQSTTL